VVDGGNTVFAVTFVAGVISADTPRHSHFPLYNQPFFFL
jgi:hypothetical protein